MKNSLEQKIPLSQVEDTLMGYLKSEKKVTVLASQDEIASIAFSLFEKIRDDKIFSRVTLMPMVFSSAGGGIVRFFAADRGDVNNLRGISGTQCLVFFDSALENTEAINLALHTCRGDDVVSQQIIYVKNAKEAKMNQNLEK